MMQKHFARLFAGMFFVVLAALPHAMSADAASVEATIRDDVIVTVGTDFFGLQYNGPTHRAIDPDTGELADFPSAYATPSTQTALTTAGIRTVRVFVDVPRVHPEPGSFDWTDTDTAVSEIEGSGMRPMLCLRQGDGSWFVGTDQQPWWTHEAGHQEWRLLAESLAERYDGRISYYEILNEPNHLHPNSKSYMGWQESVAIFTEAAEAIHQNAPESQTGGPASYGSWEPATWAKKVLDEPGGEQLLDFVSYHIYASQDLDDPDEAIFEKATMYETAPAVIRAELAAVTNKPIEVALTEFNSSSVWSHDGVLTTDPRNVDVVGGLVAALGWLYTARGGGDRAFRFGTMGGFGLIRWPPEYELLPAYHAVRLLHEVAGLTAAAELRATEVSGDDSSRVELFAIRSPEQEAVVLINKHGSESADVSVQWQGDLSERAFDLFQFSADRLPSALEPLAQLTTTGGSALLELPPHTLTVLRPVLEPPREGDFDEDGDVDEDDLAAWTTAFGVNNLADSEEDGDSDGADFLAWQTGYTGPVTPVSPVPEPASLVILLIGVVLFGSTVSFRQACRNQICYQ